MITHYLSGGRFFLLCSIVVSLTAPAAKGDDTNVPGGFDAAQWAELRNAQQLVSQKLDKLRPAFSGSAGELDVWADADLFRKGLVWATRYDQKFEAKDVALLKKAVTRAHARIEYLVDPLGAPPIKPGRSVRGFVSNLDGSTQLYGLIVPRNYSDTRPSRLDVVLHGSTRPVGLSELRFGDRFDGGDEGDPAEKVPDVNFIELHPLGRVENGYRWAGETDVYEAIEAVCRRLKIDRDRIVLRGMSMGASGTWHLGLKRPDRFVALGPYCGYVDTHRFSETPLANFVKVGRLPDVQEQTLHMLDSVDYAANAGVVPAIACMGEKDVFFDAHVIMGQAMQREGLTMVNLISPGTGHVVDPATHAEQMKRIATYVDAGLNRQPKRIRFVTWSLKYADCHWVRILGLDRHYERAELDVAVTDDHVVRIAAPRNITQFALRPPLAANSPASIEIGGQPLNTKLAPPAAGTWWRFHRVDDQWRSDANATLDVPLDERPRKRPGQQGPLDDAFTSPFVCVRGTGEPWNPTVDAWSRAALARFAYEWHRYFRGELPVKDDSAVTPDDLATKHLILFGDPGSNRWIRDALPKLPLRWTREQVSIAGQDYPAADHAPTLIVASPLAGAHGRYLVINSGHTFHEKELNTLNYLLFPRSGDWGVWKVGPPRTDAASPSDAVNEQQLAFGLADEDWKIPAKK